MRKTKGRLDGSLTVVVDVHVDGRHRLGEQAHQAGGRDIPPHGGESEPRKRGTTKSIKRIANDGKGA